jgi:hypothetical protein
MKRTGFLSILAGLPLVGGLFAKAAAAAKPASETDGTYYYRITYTNQAGETTREQPSVSLTPSPPLGRRSRRGLRLARALKARFGSTDLVAHWRRVHDLPKPVLDLLHWKDLDLHFTLCDSCGLKDVV